ncbi:MAG TPA: hypothetical protein VK495_11075 [Steroidobacteraceae bacterium]|nr:hypothetical protein [Steroidobacteraceae bacterium]
MQQNQKTWNRWLSATALGALLMSGASLSSGAARVDDLVPQTPSAFLPGGLLGIQIGGSWGESKQNPSLQQLTCQPIADASDFDEVCFFRTSTASRVAGAQIHDGFIVRKDDHVVLVGTGISIKNADDPLAESVVQSFQSQVHSAYQHTGDNVLFVKLPARHLTADELEGYSKRAPVLLVQLEAKSHELAVLYGYLGPVNAFGALTSD